MSRIHSSATPNPNSLKFTFDGRTFIDSGMESFNDAGEAAGHELGSRLFEIEGVANVFILPQFLTITKVKSARWKDIVPRIETVVTEILDDSSG